MARITISYRRDDSGVITGRIFDRLAAHYGRDAVFRDIDNIPPGVDFRKHIGRILDESDVVLAIIGPKWIGPRAGQSRLASGADPVRVEIEAALRKELPLIPVLVQRASMPRVEELRNDVRFRLPQRRRPAGQFAKILVEGKEDALVARRPCQNIGIAGRRRQRSHPNHVMPCGRQCGYGGAGKILVGEKAPLTRRWERPSRRLAHPARKPGTR